MFENIINRNDLNEKFTTAVSSGDVDKIRELFLPLKEYEKEVNAGVLSTDELEKLYVEVNNKIPFIDIEMVTAAAIMRAAQIGHWKVVIELFNLGADIDVKMAPLNVYFAHECVLNAPDEVLYPVLDYANLNVKTLKGQTPLMLSIEKSKDVTSNYIVDNANIDYSLADKELNNYAHYAAMHGKYDLLLKLVEKGVPVLSKNKKGETPIDLIKDDVFRMTFPEELERITATGKIVVFNIDGTEKERAKSNPKKEVKNEVEKIQLTGLSTINRM